MPVKDLPLIQPPQLDSIEIPIEEVVLREDGFPEKVWIGAHRPSARYACYSYKGNHGLAVSTHEGGIIRFMEFIDISGLSVEQVTFEEAVGVALCRPPTIKGIMLVDSIDNPKFVSIR